MLHRLGERKLLESELFRGADQGCKSDSSCHCSKQSRMFQADSLLQSSTVSYCTGIAPSARISVSRTAAFSDGNPSTAHQSTHPNHLTPSARTGYLSTSLRPMRNCPRWLRDGLLELRCSAIVRIRSMAQLPNSYQIVTNPVTI